MELEVSPSCMTVAMQGCRDAGVIVTEDTIPGSQADLGLFPPSVLVNVGKWCFCGLKTTGLRATENLTGLEKVSFHSNPKERQCQRMLKLLHSCTHLTRQQSNPQHSPSQASTVCEL